MKVAIQTRHVWCKWHLLLGVMNFSPIFLRTLNKNRRWWCFSIYISSTSVCTVWFRGCRIFFPEPLWLVMVSGVGWTSIGFNVTTCLRNVGQYLGNKIWWHSSRWDRRRSKYLMVYLAHGRCTLVDIYGGVCTMFVIVIVVILTTVEMLLKDPNLLVLRFYFS